MTATTSSNSGATSRRSPSTQPRKRVEAAYAEVHAENAALGYGLGSSEAADRLIGLCQSWYFTSTRRVIFDALLSLRDRGEPVDIFAVQREVAAVGNPVEVIELLTLMAAGCYDDQVNTQVEIIRRSGARREAASLLADAEAVERARAAASAKRDEERRQHETAQAARLAQHERDLAEAAFVKAITDDLAHLRRERFEAVAALDRDRDRDRAEAITDRIVVLESLEAAARLQLTPNRK